MGTQNNLHVVSNNGQQIMSPTKQRITRADASRPMSLGDHFRRLSDGTTRMLVFVKYKLNNVTFGLTDRVGIGKIAVVFLAMILLIAWRSRTVSETTETTEASFAVEAKGSDGLDWSGIIGGGTAPKRQPKSGSNSLAPASVAELNEQMVLDYIERYHKMAVTEMDKFGIPASISLAQGLIESRSGTSMLAKRCNNHFGMKCFSKKCAKGHCSNHTDDHHKDFFRIFKSSWDSWRAHSTMLASGRYRILQKYGKDYRRWAHGLRDLGYATDRSYDVKLIGIIEKFKLHQFDEL